jgi:hypothetical protein
VIGQASCVGHIPRQSLRDSHGLCTATWRVHSARPARRVVRAGGSASIHRPPTGSGERAGEALSERKRGSVEAAGELPSRNSVRSSNRGP